MNEFKKMAEKLAEAQEALEMLAGGESGMLYEGTTAHDIYALVEAVTNMTEFLEGELGSRLTRTDDREVEDMVDCWLDTASQVDARRGEVA
jgi:adenine deaminase